MKKTIRVWAPYHTYDDLFDKFILDIQNNRPAINEIALFVNAYTEDGYIPEDVQKHEIIGIQNRLQQLRKAHCDSVGLNVLCTIGQSDYGCSTHSLDNMKYSMSIDGITSYGRLCPRAAETKEFIRRLYTLYASCNPDFIWVDDDFRMQHLPVNGGCFCEECQRKFSQITNIKISSVDDLRSLLNDPKNTNIREAWVNWNADCYSDILHDIYVTVKKVNPNIKLGLMTVHPAEEALAGTKLDCRIAALQADKVRPGGGYYNDTTPIYLLHKIMGVAWQLDYEKSCSDVQYELEDYPYRSAKSIHTHINEITMAIFVGCNGFATNSIIPDCHENELYNAFSHYTPMWETIIARMKGWNLVGAQPYFNPDFEKKRVLHNDFTSPVAENIIWKEHQFFMYGVFPYATPSSSSKVHVLDGRMARTLTKVEFQSLLCESVVMDGTALEAACSLGLEEYCGCSIKNKFNDGLWERFAEHELNGTAKGAVRTCSHSVENDDIDNGYTLSLSGAEALSYLFSGFMSKESLGISSACYENKFGGRVVTLGYSPYDELSTWYRSEQLHNIAKWLFHDQIPVSYNKGNSQLFSMVSEAPDHSQKALCAVNTSLDDLDNVIIELPYEGEAIFTIFDENGAERIISPKAENMKWHICIPKWKSWQIQLIFWNQGVEK